MTCTCIAIHTNKPRVPLKLLGFKDMNLVQTFLRYENTKFCWIAAVPSTLRAAPQPPGAQIGTLARLTQVYDDDPPKVGACTRNHSESTPKATLKLNYRRPKRQIEVSSSSPQPRVVTAGDRANVWCLAEVVTFDPERVD